MPQCGTDVSGLWVRSAALWVVVLALLIRLVYVLETGAVPMLRHLVGDAAGYYRWAEAVGSGQWLGSEPFYQAPLYPYVLAVIFRTLGDQVWLVRVVQAVWGAVAAGFLVVAVDRLFDRRAGLVAGVMAAVYGPAVFFDGIVQKASLGWLLTCALLAVMVRVGTPGASRLHVGLAGVLVGLLALVRENALIWMVVLLFWLLVSCCGTRRRIGRLAAFLVGVAVILAPVGIRNAVVGGEWSVTTFQAGPNFFIGNSAAATGRYQPLVPGHETPTFERRDAAELAQRAMGRELTAGEVSGYWMSRAWHDISADPGRWVRLLGGKLLMVWNAYEVSDVESQYVYDDSSVLLSVLGRVWHFGVLCPAAMVGIVATGRQWRRLWVFYAMIFSMSLAVAAFYVMARYRFPLAPLLIPFAAVGCVWIWDKVVRRDFGSLLRSIVPALAVAVIVNWPIHDERRLDALAYMNVGVALAGQGDLDGALPYFYSAVAGHPESAEANSNLAQALALKGEYERAIEHYRRAVVVKPSLPGLHYNLAVALERTGRVKEAVRFYELAVERDPSDVDARAAVARLRSTD